MSFNMLDYLLILILLLGTIWGLLRGVGRLLVGLFSLYVGLVVSLMFYRPLANYFRDLLPNMSVSGSETLAFVFLLLVFVNGFSFFTRYFGTPPEERKRRQKGQVREAVEKGGARFLIGPLSQLAGMLAGFVVTVVWISLLLAVLQFSLRAGGAAIGGAGASIRQQMSASVLVGVSNYVLFFIYQSVSWLPGGVPSIFAGLLEQLY